MHIPYVVHPPKLAQYCFICSAKRHWAGVSGASAPSRIKSEAFVYAMGLLLSLWLKTQLNLHNFGNRANPNWRPPRAKAR